MVYQTPISLPNLSPNFIGSWTIKPDSLCDDLIDYFEVHKEKQIKGSTSSAIVRPEIKDRTDISIAPNEINKNENIIFQSYFENIFNFYKDYNAQWPFLKQIIGDTLIIGRFNMGRYDSGQHFQKVHCERSSIDTLHRMFAFMTYLNNVEEGGSTYFNHYDLEVQPRKGLTLIWPAEWTHVHKGNVVIKGTKYILTGHLIFKA